MLVGARGDLRRMRHRHHLHLAGEPRQPGAEPRSDSTTLSASRNRDSSPPEATFIKGPGRVPGLVCTQNSTRSKPCGPGDFGSDSTCVANLARSSFSGASSALTALLSFSADLVRAAESFPAAAL